MAKKFQTSIADLFMSGKRKECTEDEASPSPSTSTSTSEVGPRSISENAPKKPKVSSTTSLSSKQELKDSARKKKDDYEKTSVRGVVASWHDEYPWLGVSKI